MSALELDAVLFQPSDVAEICDLDQKTVANWTDRGLGRPYGQHQGRGRSRLYSGRDLLRFFLMARMERRGVSIAVMVRLCNQVFGDAFSPKTARYLTLEVSRDGQASGMTWHPDIAAVERNLQTDLVDLVVNVAEIVREVTLRADIVRRRKESGPS